MQVLERPKVPAAIEEELRRVESEEDVEMGSDGPEEEFEDDEDYKDETEIELERLIFGDSAGFRKGLKGGALQAQDEHDEEDEMDMNGLDDADVGQALRQPFVVCAVF